MGEHAYAHVPVLAGRVTALLVPALTGPRPDGGPPVLVDATLGRAGHARALLDACPGLLLIGIDADEAAIEAGRALAAEYPGQVTLAHAFYDQIGAIVARAGHRRVQGVLFDLGVSSPQLDDTSRGFSYAQDAPLDMRMDQTAEQDRGTRRQRLPGPRAGPGARRVRRGALRAADRRSRRAGNARASRSPRRCG